MSFDSAHVRLVVNYSVAVDCINIAYYLLNEFFVSKRERAKKVNIRNSKIVTNFHMFFVLVSIEFLFYVSRHHRTLPSKKKLLLFLLLMVLMLRHGHGCSSLTAIEDLRFLIAV
eukprot:Rmarinus@m.3168